MFNKHYVGKKVSRLELNGDFKPITGVSLMVDREKEYFSGNETGYVLTAECPYATQRMADEALARVAGKVYTGFSASGASLAIDAERGDGVTIGGKYGLLVNQVLTFGPGHTSDITAPGEAEVDHEYPYISSLEREFNRQLAQTRSLISKTSDEIRLEVRGLDGLVSSLAVTLDGVTITDQYGVTRIKGSSIETGSITADKIDATNLRVDAANVTGTITAGKLRGNSVDLSVLVYLNGWQEVEADVGYINIVDTKDGDGIQIGTKYGRGGIRMSAPEGNWWVDAQYGSFGITSSGVVCSVPPVPQNSAVTLGSFGFPWADIYTAHGTFSSLVARVAALEAR